MTEHDYRIRLRDALVIAMADSVAPQREGSPSSRPTVHFEDEVWRDINQFVDKWEWHEQPATLGQIEAYVKRALSRSNSDEFRQLSTCTLCKLLIHVEDFKRRTQSEHALGD